jgi:hypothetical protein
MPMFVRADVMKVGSFEACRGTPRHDKKRGTTCEGHPPPISRCVKKEAVSHPVGRMSSVDPGPPPIRNPPFM